MRAVLVEPPARPVLAAVEPAPRPEELPVLLPARPLLDPLGAEVVRVAILATVPELGRISGDLGAAGPRFAALKGLRPAVPLDTGTRAGNGGRC
ncbi:hypothetical protein GCM10011577_10430 [Pseudarthrobacter polychromogenes]|uniref:Uncharacterized protein n=1 Tax=Pseudarthrobacter polychromogenes TaxID=1676 RepID=A0ABQ1XCE0_9MICC|nr:hypothetical protein GCM10011577_10430 [Pseudarthrobacter polychromogenes]